MNQEERRELFELYKLAHAEYRAEVSLGWERQKLFLTLNPAVAAFAAGFQRSPVLAVAALALAMAASVAGIVIVGRAHGRYRATRAALQARENELGITPLETTGGMREARGEPRLEGVRVVTVVRVVLAFYALFDAVGIVIVGSSL